ncbi:MAG: hypothetical protein AB7P02_13285 [Alphaproteobacteria bacterium]
MTVLRLWLAHRGPGEAVLALPAAAGAPAMLRLPSPEGPLPFAGGSAEQPCWLMDAFAVMAAAAALLRRRTGDV